MVTKITKGGIVRRVKCHVHQTELVPLIPGKISYERIISSEYLTPEQKETFVSRLFEGSALMSFNY